MHQRLVSGYLVVALSGSSMLATTGTADAAEREGGSVQTAALSPAGCNITYVSDAHPSKDPKNKVPVAAKVNAKTECKTAVPWLTLQVTIVDLNTGEKYNSQTTAEGRNFLFNQSAFLPCPETETHMYQGLALGTSTENGRNYFQEKEGKSVPLNCSRPRS